MQRVVLVRYDAKPDRAAENEALSRKVFDELRAVRPDGVTYALFRDGDAFVHVFINMAADDSTALTELASFKAFAEDVLERCVAPPEQTRLSVQLVEAYGLSSAMATA